MTTNFHPGTEEEYAPDHQLVVQVKLHSAGRHCLEFICPGEGTVNIFLNDAQLARVRETINQYCEKKKPS